MKGSEMQLSVLIPARNEDMLNRTIEDVLLHSEAETEVIVVLDGYLPDPPLTVNDERVTLIYNPSPKGQRAATNQACKLAKGKYVMKLDAHCALDQGFDKKMLEGFKEAGDNVTMIPAMKNLHAFDWVCTNNHRRYQGKEGVCPECGGKETQDILWQPKNGSSRFTFRFDKSMHFQYWGELGQRQPQTPLRETMSIQGSCFMLTREKYLELDISSETDFHSWGQQGVEVACKTWMSGGRVLANTNTWYAHMFRTNNFGGFPYDNPQSLVNENREKSRELFERNGWPKATRPFQWILDHFAPVPEWSDTNSKGIIYYTDNNPLKKEIVKPCIEKLITIATEKELPIVTASLKKRLSFGAANIVFPTLERGYYALFKQVLAAIEHSTSDILFFTEADVLYHPSHFDFVPKDKNTFYYNQNVWYVRQDGHALHYDVNQLSGLCVYRETALLHFKERLARIEKEGFSRNMGFEPFTHHRLQWEHEFSLGTWQSPFPNIDIRFGVNSTGMRWKKEEYRNQHLLINWQETDNFQIPGWTGLDKLTSLLV